MNQNGETQSSEKKGGSATLVYIYTDKLFSNCVIFYRRNITLAILKKNPKLKGNVGTKMAKWTNYKTVKSVLSFFLSVTILIS